MTHIYTHTYMELSLAPLKKSLFHETSSSQGYTLKTRENSLLTLDLCLMKPGFQIRKKQVDVIAKVFLFTNVT